MSDDIDKETSNNYDHHHKKNFTARESEHIKVRTSNGSSSRYSPYQKSSSTVPKSRRHDDHGSDSKKQENIYRIPTQTYPSFEAKSSPKAVQPVKKKMTVASVFNCDSSEDEEEMPLHAKMKMRNVGKDTPTSSGPNSFGKTKKGFTDTVKMWEKDPVKVAQFIVNKKEQTKDD